MSDWPKDWKQQAAEAGAGDVVCQAEAIEAQVNKREQIRAALHQIANAHDGLNYYSGRAETDEYRRSIMAHLEKASDLLTPLLAADRGDDDLASAERVIDGIDYELFKRQDRWFADELWRKFLESRVVVRAALRASREFAASPPTTPATPSTKDQKADESGQ